MTMQTISRSALLTLVVACQPPAATPSRPTLETAVAEYDSAWNAKDTTRLRTLLSDRYVYVSSLGDLSPKAKTLAFVADTGYTLTSARRSELAYEIVGPTARVTSRWQGEGHWTGGAIHDNQTCGQTWVWLTNRWVLFTEHCVNRPPAADSARTAN